MKVVAGTVADIKKGDTFRLASSETWVTAAKIKTLGSSGNDGRKVTAKSHSGTIRADRVIIEYKGGGRDIYCTEHRVVKQKR